MGGSNLKVKAVSNGPYLVDSKEKGNIALCRCGQSKNKPYCDGSHVKANFKAEQAELDI